MSEQRRHRPEAGETETAPAATITTHFADAARTYVKIVAPFTVPVVSRYNDRIGTLFTEADWRVLNAARLAKVASQGRAAISTGKQASKSDADKQTWLVNHVNSFELDPEDLGIEFETSLLEQAVDRVFFNIALHSPGSGITGDYSANSTTAHKLARKPMVDTIMSDPERLERYVPLVEAMLATILAERHKVTERTAKAKPELAKVAY